MIGWEQVYKVIVVMVPLYVPLVLGFISVKFLHMFNQEQTEAINRLLYYFILPLLIFDFTSHVNPYNMNFHFICADAISKIIIAIVLVIWAKFSRKGSFAWTITSFSLSTLTNIPIVGLPLVKAMYDRRASDIVAQSFVLQSIIWSMILLFMFELRRTKTDSPSDIGTIVDSRVHSLESGQDSEANTSGDARTRPSFWSLMKIVGIEIAKNPITYSCILGVLWAILAYRFHIKMPSIVEGSILMMSRGGSGIAMFSLGLFMAFQEKIIASSASLTLLGLALRFVVAPAIMGISSIAVGLRGEILRVAIVQAAFPQSIMSFIFAKQYDLHASVLSTAVIFGTFVSVPLLIVYCVILDLLH